MYLSILRTLLLSTGFVLLVSACGIDTERPPDCRYVSGNLFADPEFSTLNPPSQKKAWVYSQHAKDISFRYHVKEGTLSFVKTGTEPWGILAQSIDVNELMGKRVELSAELKLDLSEPKGASGFPYGGGLTLLVKRGDTVRLSSDLAHEPHIGTHDWQRVSVVTNIPKRSSYLRAGFLHQAEGKMQVRNPALRIVTVGCEPVVVNG